MDTFSRFIGLDQSTDLQEKLKLPPPCVQPNAGSNPVNHETKERPNPMPAFMSQKRVPCLLEVGFPSMRMDERRKQCLGAEDGLEQAGGPTQTTVRNILGGLGLA